MAGEQFATVLIVGFAAFAVWLVVRIFNSDRQAIWIAAALSVPILVILAIFAHLLWMGMGV